MSNTTLAPLSRFLARDRGVPSSADYHSAGLIESEGNIIRPDADVGHCLGLSNEFGIVARAWDGKNILTGRFLVQDHELHATEILHHTYFLK